jgi:phosphoglycerate dehydrogenase-like enzyme
MQDKLNVLVTVDFSDAIMERLKNISPRLRVTQKFVRNASEIPADVWAETDILYTMGVVPEPEQAPRLKWVQGHFAGVDSVIDKPLFRSKDLILTSAAGIHATTMAELTFGMILYFARKFPLALQMQQRAEWLPNRHQILLPRELRRSTLGIVGYGAIGREIARIGKAFGMEVLATKRDAKNPAFGNSYAEPGTGDPDGSMVDRLYPSEATRSMVALCDFVVLTVPLYNGTKAFFDADMFGAMKKTAVLINMARGGVVDEPAMIKALQNGQIAGAGLDVFAQEPLPANSPLWKMDNVLITPHIAGNTDRYHETAADLFAGNLERYLERKELMNRVDTERGY